MGARGKILTVTESLSKFNSYNTCDHQQRGTCNMLRRRKEIKSTVTKEKFQITDRMTCATIRVIYVIECEKCNLQYVGQTNKSEKL